MGFRDYIERQIEALEKERQEGHAHMTGVYERIERAESMRKADTSVGSFRKWNAVLDTLERELDHAKARIAKCDAELRQKRRRLTEFQEQGSLDGPDFPENEAPLLSDQQPSPGPKPLVERTVRAGSAEAIGGEKPDLLQSGLRKIASGHLGRITLDEVGALVERYRELRQRNKGNLSEERLIDILDLRMTALVRVWNEMHGKIVSLRDAQK